MRLETRPGRLPITDCSRPRLAFTQQLILTMVSLSGAARDMPLTGTRLVLRIPAELVRPTWLVTALPWQDSPGPTLSQALARPPFTVPLMQPSPRLAQPRTFKEIQSPGMQCIPL